jgi:Polyketide cyclase / dehydrase and lipid transport
MWETEHGVETRATPEQVWKVWADVPRWSEWNAGVAQVELRGAFVAGSTIVMTPPDQEPIELRIAEAVEPVQFVDEADLGDVVVTTTHRVSPLEVGSRITYRMQITGPAADTLGPEIGPEISGDFPQVLAALADRAERS